MRSQVHMIQETVTTTQGRPDSHKAQEIVAFVTRPPMYNLLHLYYHDI